MADEVYEIHLEDPDGNHWVAGHPAEANDLCAQGYRRLDGPPQDAAKDPVRESPSQAPSPSSRAASE